MEDKISREPHVFLIYLAIGLLAVAAAVLILRMLDIHDPAAWVQAVGSVGAIGAAIYVLDRQNKNATKLLQRTEDMSILRKYAGIAALVDHANNLIQESGGRIRPPNDLSRYFFRSHNEAAYSDVKNALLAIPLYDLWSYDMVVGVREMCDVVQAAINTLDQMGSSPNALGDYHKVAFSHFSALVVQSSEAHEKVRLAIQTLGGMDVIK
ncbi:hypothetical protein SAMN04515620_1672 [Collimonas sp. OK607]|uniref:hypothetical protein n=1 Tax=Collimonas sp. OK607 TaxID=1798194 RepID=UPI0008E0D0FD|nr:hypothetical protein [Collimonas sp. OK607]SFB40114.1 hypothetical protein SAMN04515620_1672 [Collimonas sp. OK607]